MLKAWRSVLAAREGKAKAYSTWYSQAVSHPSTNQARPCLASEIDEIGRAQGGMAVSEYNAQMLAIYRRHTGGVFLKDFKKQGCHACVL